MLKECLDTAKREYDKDRSEGTECRNQNFMMKTANCRKKNLEVLNMILRDKLQKLQRKGPSRTRSVSRSASRSRSPSRSRSASRASGRNRRRRTRRRHKKRRTRRTRGRR